MAAAMLRRSTAKVGAARTVRASNNLGDFWMKDSVGALFYLFAVREHGGI